MSTKVTELHDNLLERLVNLYPNSTRLPNAYDLEKNADAFKFDGYGIKIGPATNAQTTLSNIVGINREFSVIFVTNVIAREADIESRSYQEKILMENIFTLINDIETDETLNGAASDTQYVSDSGVNFVTGGRFNYVYTEVKLACRYFEILN